MFEPRLREECRLDFFPCVYFLVFVQIFEIFYFRCGSYCFSNYLIHEFQKCSSSFCDFFPECSRIIEMEDLFYAELNSSSS